MILWPSTSRTWPGSNGSIMRCSRTMRRIHLSALMLMGSGVLHHDARKCLVVAGARSQPRGRASCHMAIGAGDRPLGVRRHDRLARVGKLADSQIQRQLTEERHLVLGGKPRSPAGTEDVLFVAAL